jgi:hypothetical protein
VPSYLVETFLARGAAGERQARERRARSAAEEMTRKGARVALVAELAGLEPLRVVEALSSAKEEQ